MNYYVGIDPSMNSTGICIQKFDENNEKINENFVILKPVNIDNKNKRRLTKKEQAAEESIFNFQYWFYDKHETNKEDPNTIHEYCKSLNMTNCANEIKNIVKEYTKDNTENIYIVIEGISYGSTIRTKSIFDLAGLNYLVREKFINTNENIRLIIPTPSEIKKFASGNGNCKKEIMINLFKISHNDFDIVPKVDDISDAWFMSNYALHMILNNVLEGYQI